MFPLRIHINIIQPVLRDDRAGTFEAYQSLDSKAEAHSLGWMTGHKVCLLNGRMLIRAWCDKPNNISKLQNHPALHS